MTCVGDWDAVVVGTAVAGAIVFRESIAKGAFLISFSGSLSGLTVSVFVREIVY